VRARVHDRREPRAQSDPDTRRKALAAVEDLLTESSVEVCGVDVARLIPGSTLEELGIDSLASAEVLVELEIRLGRNLPAGTLRRLGDVETLGELSAVLEAAFASDAQGQGS
jgi:acyl carrier protein